MLPLPQTDKKLYDYVEPARVTLEGDDEPIIAAITATDAFQRLRKVRFLGGIDYLLVPSPNGHKGRYTRYQHSIGVARLAEFYADCVGMDRATKRLIYAAALLHDIGHAPLSHTLEPVFKRAFGIDHHGSTEDVVLGGVEIGREVRDILLRLEIDPLQVTAILSGKEDPCNGFFNGPINFDTIEGVLRTRQYAAKSYSDLTPARVVSAALGRVGVLDRDIVSTFWSYKNDIYSLIIRSKAGVMADYICQVLADRHILRIKKEDYLSTERSIFRKLPEIRIALNLGVVAAMEKFNVGLPEKFTSRCFYVDKAVDFFANEFKSRYRQNKSTQFFAQNNLVVTPEEMVHQMNLLDFIV